MSGDHNMYASGSGDGQRSGWRKRTIMELAREAGICTWLKPPADVVERIEAFAALVREDEAEKYKWDIHSCGPTCTKVGCVAVREAVKAEREAWEVGVVNGVVTRRLASTVEQPQRTWVELTDEEYEEIWRMDLNNKDIMDKTIAKLKEKNT